MIVNNPTNLPAAVPANVTQWLGTAVNENTAGYPVVDVGRWRDGVPNALNGNGLVDVNLEEWIDTAPNALVFGLVHAAPEMAYNTPGGIILPTPPAVGLTVASSASANTFGSWTEITASLAADSQILGVSVRPASSHAYSVIQIASGAAASETVQSTFPILAANGFSDGDNFLPLTRSIRVSSGTRLALRVADEAASADNYTMHLYLVAIADLDPLVNV